VPEHQPARLALGQDEGRARGEERHERLGVGSRGQVLPARDDKRRRAEQSRSGGSAKGDVPTRPQISQESLPADAEEAAVARGDPRVADLAGHGDEQDGVGAVPPGSRKCGDGQRVRGRNAALAAPLGLLDVLEHGPGVQRRQGQLDASVAQQGQLAGARRRSIDADDGPNVQPETREGEGRIRHGPAEPPAAGVV
jgi:hypothetical protein